MTLAQAIAATAELCGTKLSEIGADMLLTDLEGYPEPDVIQALTRCRRELKGRLTLAEIVSRIDDGRPGPDEAWAALAWEDEETAVLTREMEQAQGAAWHAYHAGDRAGSARAFREAYTALVQQARTTGQPVEWHISMGWDRDRREAPIRDAIARGRITTDQAARFLPGVCESHTRRIAPNRGGGMVPFAQALGSKPLPEESADEKTHKRAAVEQLRAQVESA